MSPTKSRRQNAGGIGGVLAAAVFLGAICYFAWQMMSSATARIDCGDLADGQALDDATHLAVTVEAVGNTMEVADETADVLAESLTRASGSGETPAPVALDIQFVISGEVTSTGGCLDDQLLLIADQDVVKQLDGAADGSRGGLIDNLSADRAEKIDLIAAAAADHIITTDLTALADDDERGGVTGPAALVNLAARHATGADWAVVVGAFHTSTAPGCLGTDDPAALDDPTDPTQDTVIGLLAIDCAAAGGLETIPASTVTFVDLDTVSRTADQRTATAAVVDALCAAVTAAGACTTT